MSKPYPLDMASGQIRRMQQTWGRQVRARRVALRWSQRQLGERCAEFGRAITQGTISKIERGLLMPRDPVKLVLARALRARPEDLFPWEELSPERAGTGPGAIASRGSTSSGEGGI